MGKSIFFTCVVFLGFLFVVYIARLSFLTIIQSKQLYSRIKTNTEGWGKQVHVADDLLGYVPIPNSKGFQGFDEKAVPVKYDKHGFRIPEKSLFDTKIKPPVVMALGCSHTFGAGISAEDTYVSIVAEKSGGVALNAGRCGYGLSQMLIVAREMIPAFKPDYVLVQYSPWLATRATSYYGPTRYSKLPVPWFSDASDGFKLNKPLFSAAIFDVQFNKYRSATKTTSEFLLFLWDIGFPLFVRDAYYSDLFFIKNRIGMLQSPTKSHEDLVAYVYHEFAKLAGDNNGQLYIVIIGRGVERHLTYSDTIKNIDSAIVIDANEALFGRLKNETLESYASAYWTSANDVHPNPNAHEVIAEEIVKAILYK